MSHTEFPKDKTNESVRPLKRIFDAVPKRYDFLNRLLTFRMDERWRRKAAIRCIEDTPSTVMDLCCGTGDLALRLASLSGQEMEIIGLDFSPDMLGVARSKAKRLGLDKSVRFIEGDATSMDFPDGYFDVVCIAFGFRNLTWRSPSREPALAEIRRVLRPGGKFIVVETSQPTNRLLRAGFHTYMDMAAAPIGGWLSGHKPAYKYLAKSAKNFYNAQEVCTMLEDAGFHVTQVSPLMGGLAAIHETMLGESR